MEEWDKVVLQPSEAELTVQWALPGPAHLLQAQSAGEMLQAWGTVFWVLGSPEWHTLSNGLKHHLLPRALISSPIFSRSRSLDRV